MKRDAYLGYGVSEYWRFDHTGGRYHVSALAGDVLVDGEYQPKEITHEPDGLIWGHSAVLGLDLCWDAGDLRFRDPESDEFLLTPEEQPAGGQRRVGLRQRRPGPTVPRPAVSGNASRSSIGGGDRRGPGRDRPIAASAGIGVEPI